MQPPLLPNLPGLGWSVHKRPTFATRVAGHVSGREVRAPLFAQTLYEFELTIDGLAATSDPALAGLGAGSLQTLAGFFLACQGRLMPFLYVDSTDCTVAGQIVGTGDGSTTTFVLQRNLGAFTEPVSWVTGITLVAVNGNPQAGWALVQPNSLVLASAPAAGATVTATFAYAYLCRFLDDQQDFENIVRGLWRVKSLRFRSVRSA